jgi:hypothetical protein
MFHVNLLFTEELLNSPITHCELVVNSPLQLTCTNSYLADRLVLYWYCPYSTGASLPSVSPINAGIRHAANAAPCTVAHDVTEVTWSLPTVARPSSYPVTQQHAERREGKGGEARRGSAPLLLRNRYYATIFLWYILIFMFLDSSRGDKRFWTEW